MTTFANELISTDVFFFFYKKNYVPGTGFVCPQVIELRHKKLGTDFC